MIVKRIDLLMEIQSKRLFHHPNPILQPPPHFLLSAAAWHNPFAEHDPKEVASVVLVGGRGLLS